MRRTARNVGIALLAVLAVAFAASTLDTASTQGSDAPGLGGGADGLIASANISEIQEPGQTIPYLNEIITVLLVIAVLGTIVYLYLDFWEAVKTAGMILGIVIVLAALLWVLTEILAQGDAGVFEQQGPGNFGLPTEGGAGSGSGHVSPVGGALLVVAIAVAGAVALFWIVSRQRSESMDEPAAPPDTDAAAIGRAAGRAADRLERDAAMDNEVYRTWTEMTELLDMPDPDTSTPGEFATVAIESGLGKQDVEALTRLFEDVRYGAAPPSEDRERTALEVFRRIERRYAEEAP